jgi:hypothetical protein
MTSPIPRPQKRIWIIALAILVSAPVWLSCLGCFPWSPINCWHYDVDIHTGRERYTRVFLFTKVAQRVEESAVSAALKLEDVRGVQPDWQRVATGSPRAYGSPHYSFQAAHSQILELESYWRMGEFTSSARRASAKRMLQLWQRGQGASAAGPYLLALLRIVTDMEHKVDEGDLPPVS